jgi:MYXO-CTERM domain-containing protein
MVLFALLFGCGRPVTLTYGLPPPLRLRLSEASLALDGLRLDACGAGEPTTLHIGDRIGATSLLEERSENLPAGEPCGLTLLLEPEATVTLHLRGETESGTAFVLDAKAPNAGVGDRLRLEAGAELVLLVDGDALLPAALLDDRAAAGGSLSLGPDDPLSLQVADGLANALFVGDPAEAELRFGAAWTTFAPTAAAEPPEEPGQGCNGGDPAPTDSASDGTDGADGADGADDTAAADAQPEGRSGCNRGEDTGADATTEERRGCDRGDDTSAALLPLGLGLIAARRRRPPGIAPPRP